MTRVQIKIYQSGPSASRDERKLVKTIDVEVDSEKPLNAARAAKIIKRELPDFLFGGRVFVIKAQYGWEASRFLEASGKCDYHYTWEYAVVME